MLSRKGKRGKLSKTAIVTKIVSILVSILLLLGTKYVARGDDFINDITNKTEETHIVSVRVLKSSGITKLSQIQNKPCAVSYQHDTSNVTKAISEFEKQKGSDFNLVKKDDYKGVLDALYNKTAKAIIIGNEYLGLVEDQYTQFRSDTVEIANFKIKKKMDQVTKPTKVTKEPFTVYLTGIDTYGDIDEVARSDVNLLLTVNPTTKQMLIVSIPRDMQVTLASYNAMDKLTHSGIYGVDETIKTIEKFLSVDVNYWARTNFSGMKDIIDQLDGVTIYSPYKDFRTLHGDYLITKGEHKMFGDQALSFVRERYRLPDGDYDRGRNQQRLLKAMMSKAMSPKIITNFSNILSAIEGTFETNMSNKEIRSLLNMQMDDMAGWDIVNAQVSGSPSYTLEAYSSKGHRTYVTIPNKKSVQKTEELIKKILANDKLTKEDLKGANGEEQ